MFNDFTSTSGWDTFNGEKFEVDGGSDAWSMFPIPNGYKVTGMVLYFDNVPDEIRVREGYYANGSSNTLIYSTTSPSSTTNVTFSTPIYGDGWYVYMEFWNDSINKFQFNGGYFKIERI